MGTPPALPFPAPIFGRKGRKCLQCLAPPPGSSLPQGSSEPSCPPKASQTTRSYTLLPSQVCAQSPAGVGGQPPGRRSHASPSRCGLGLQGALAAQLRRPVPSSSPQGPVLEPVGSWWLCAHGRASSSWQGLFGAGLHCAAGRWEHSRCAKAGELQSRCWGAGPGLPSCFFASRVKHQSRAPHTRLSLPLLCLTVCVWESSFAGTRSVGTLMVSREGRAGLACGGHTFSRALAGSQGARC